MLQALAGAAGYQHKAGGGVNTPRPAGRGFKEREPKPGIGGAKGGGVVVVVVCPSSPGTAVSGWPRFLAT